MAVKIIHSADWQLGKPFGRFSQEVRNALSEARLDAIDRLAAVATDVGAPHVLVAGDVFDNVEPGDRIVTQALARMERGRCTWWLMPGNHDHARAGGLWGRVRARAPSNVRVVDVPQPVEMEAGVWLLPTPLEHRKMAGDPTAAMVDMPTPLGALRIGLAHGSITEFGGVGESANLIPPDRARSAGLDYLALGDWHGYLIVGERTAYSGTPEVDRFGRDEAGACIAATVRAGESPALTRVETGRFRWLTRHWELAGTEDFERELDTLRRSVRLSDTLLSLTVGGVVSLAERVAILASLEDRLADELRHLDLIADAMRARPTADDIAQFDVQGALAGAAASLRAHMEANGSDSSLAAAALERLYIEVLRTDAEAGR